MGDVAGVDPRREIEEHLDIAGENGFDIIRNLETQNHADHVFTHGRLAEATGARIDISKDVDAKYELEPLPAFYEAP